MCLLLMQMGSAQGNGLQQSDDFYQGETSAEQKINICDFKGGEIDFPHPPSENQGLILEYSVNSKSSCDAFIGNSHNMHYQLEIVSFDENVQKICLGLTKSQRPTLQILQMREVIDVSKDKKTGHRLRNTDLCQLFGLLEKYEKSLPHLFIFNHKKEIHNVLGMRINGRLGGPSFKLRLTRIPTPPKNPIFVTAGSPTRLQCLSACPSDTATLFYVDESGRIRNITDRAMTETIATGQNRPFLENIVIEGEAKGFRRSCSSKLLIAKVYKIQLEDPIRESGRYIFSFGNEEDCTFILNAEPTITTASTTTLAPTATMKPTTEEPTTTTTTGFAEDGTIRLVNGNASEGLIEIYYQGEWGTICNDEWSLDNAHVACKQLGYKTAISWDAYGKYGEANFSQPILLDEVQCSGTEKTLASCSHNGWGNHNCAHYEDVGVTCWTETILGPCDSTWRSRSGKTCQSYAENRFCTQNGTYGSGWRKGYGTFENWADSEGRTALVCPECGCKAEGSG